MFVPFGQTPWQSGQCRFIHFGALPLHPALLWCVAARAPVEALLTLSKSRCLGTRASWEWLLEPCKNLHDAWEARGVQVTPQTFLQVKTPHSGPKVICDTNSSAAAVSFLQQEQPELVDEVRCTVKIGRPVQLHCTLEASNPD